MIEVLEALPGRPIRGLRVVRPDGTVSLGFYGDLDVAGLNRHEIKEKLVEHLRKYISDDYLGLSQTDPGDPEDPNDDKEVPVDPKDSDRVFVDESSFSDAVPVRKQTSGATGEKLDRILRSLAELRRPGPTSGRPEPEIARRLADHDRRLGEIESKLDRLIQAIEGLK